MDGIASLAISAFDSVQKFRAPNWAYRYDVVEVTILSDDGDDCKFESGEAVQSSGPMLTHSKLPENSLVSWIDNTQCSTSTGSSHASLRIVHINWNLEASLNISKQSFTEIFDVMGAHPAVKYMICYDYDGYHEFTAQQGYLSTRFIGTPIYAILWTFDPVHGATKALFMRRRLEPFSRFVDMLRAFQAHIHTPWLLAFVSSYLILQWSDRETSYFELDVLQNVELKTGFGPQPSGLRGLQAGDMEGKFDINFLTTWSQQVNEVSGNIGNKVRHQKISRTVLGVIKEAKVEGCSETHCAMAVQEMRSLEALSLAVPMLERQLNTDLDYLVYLKDRAEKLSAVLFALLTHEDAAASINIAAASKRDSSSMKTVAVMTMAFLPATFFAALFAVPSLRWDREEVVQHNFWVYWAFTLPSTAMVFLVWYLITQ